MDATFKNNLPAIRILSLTKHFNGQTVLDGLDLDIFRGETVVILGASGSGKSVLVSLLVGLLEPDSGRILIDGHDITVFEDNSQWEELRSKIGFLFQGSALYDSLSIGENIAFVLRHRTTLPENRIWEIVRQKLKLVELEGVEDKMPAELSGGMQKRAALARAITFDPSIIMYDEPTTGLDPIRSKHISELIRKLQQDLGVTSIVVTHDLVCAGMVADRLAFLNQGKFCFVGTNDELRRCEDRFVQEFLEAGTFRC